jgi:hypothetical protein
MLACNSCYLATLYCQSYNELQVTAVRVACSVSACSSAVIDTSVTVTFVTNIYVSVTPVTVC